MGHMKGFQLDHMPPKFTLWKNLQLLNYWFLKVKFDVTSFLLSPPTIPHIVNSCLRAFCNKVCVSGSFSVYVGWSTGDWNDNDNWAHLIPRGRQWGDQEGFFRVHFTRSAVNCLAQLHLRCKWYFPGDLLFSQSAVRQCPSRDTPKLQTDSRPVFIFWQHVASWLQCSCPAQRGDAVDLKI